MKKYDIYQKKGERRLAFHGFGNSHNFVRTPTAIPAHLSQIISKRYIFDKKPIIRFFEFKK